MIMPIRIIESTNATNELLQENILATFNRGYETLKPETCSGDISIVGSGPSLAWTYKDLTGDVMACNGAHDFLVSKGILPKYAMMWDANPIMAGMITPQHGVTYLLASRCHPSVFEKLRNYHVLVWHALGDEMLPELCAKHCKTTELAIAGGSSGVLRAIYVALTMGYKGAVHLFGIDSSYADEDTHISGSLVPQQTIRIRVNGRWFKTTPWLAAQGEQFKVMVSIIKKEVKKLVVHGHGLIPFTATFLGCETPDIKVGWAEKHLIRPWHSLHALYDLLRHSPTTLEISHAGV